MINLIYAIHYDINTKFSDEIKIMLTMTMQDTSSDSKSLTF